MAKSALSFSLAYRFSSTTKLMSVPRWRTEASSRFSLFCRHSFLKWVPAVEMLEKEGRQAWNQREYKTLLLIKDYLKK